MTTIKGCEVYGCGKPRHSKYRLCKHHFGLWMRRDDKQENLDAFLRRAAAEIPPPPPPPPLLLLYDNGWES